MDSDDDMPVLSALTLAALQLFRQEEALQKAAFEKLYQKLEEQFERRQFSIDAFKEDWQLSQFWYADDTAEILARMLLEGADETTVICIASAPLVYAAITRLAPEEIPTEHIYLLEFDLRFGVMTGKDHFFVYDYNKPNDVPEVLRNKCHRLLIDPPFLEEECQTKLAQAARNLMVDDGSKTRSGDVQCKLISSTGERMREIMERTYPETRVTTFHPEHKNGLSNEFRCYASFECKYWTFEK